ncbi:MAG: ribonuclease P protein component [Gemmatimonadota bacterium]|nr:MAG: ribonuclease P protein component [Gemmatimonadota bacterium]
MTSEGLPRSWRLTRASDIQAVVKSGCHRGSKRLDVFWVDSDLGHPRLGLVVPKHGAKAVVRNRLRRKLREIARRSVLPELASMDVVLRTRASAYEAEFRDLAADLERWLQSLSDPRSGRGRR